MIQSSVRSALRLPVRSAVPLLRKPPLAFSPASLRAAPSAILANLSHRPISTSPSSFATATAAVSPSASSPSSSSSSPPPPPPAEDVGLAQRLRILFRTHGWSALVIYLLLSVLDFGLTFVVIYTLGADRVRDAEDWVLDALEWRRKDGEPGKIKKAVTSRVETWKHQPASSSASSSSPAPHPASEPAVAEPPSGKPVREPSGYNAIATTAVLAYAIHKVGLLPIRIGLTVWITPRAVRLLQSWGWKVGMNTGTVAATVPKAASAS